MLAEVGRSAAGTVARAGFERMVAEVCLPMLSIFCLFVLIYLPACFFFTGVSLNRHLPDPPLDSFDSDKVNTSDTAYALGAPDGALSLAGLAVNLPVAAFGGISRAEQIPYVPLAAAVKCGFEAAAVGWYLY